MKKYIALLCLAAIMLASCTSNQNRFEETHFPFQKDNGGLWGFVDANGKVVVEEEFKNQPSFVIDGMFIVKTSDRSDLLSVFSINNPNNPVAEGLKDIAYFTDGLAPCVREGEGIKYIDKQGNEKFELPLEYVYAKKFENGYSLIARKEKGEFFWDAINEKGNILKLSDFSLLVPLRNGEFLADKGNSCQYCIIDNGGNVKMELEGVNNYYFANFGYKNYPNADADLMKVLFDFDTDNTFDPNYKYYIFNDANKEYGYSNNGVKSIDGNILIKGKEHTDLFFLKNGKIKFRNEDDEYGIEDVKGNVLIRPKFKSIETFGNNEYIVAKASGNGWKYGLINQKENHVLGLDYDNLTALSENTLLATVHDFDVINGQVPKRQIITTKGKVLGEYANVASTSDYGVKDYNCVKSDYFDVRGLIESMLYPRNYTYSIDDFYGYLGLSPAACNSKWGNKFSVYDIASDNNWMPYVDMETNEYGKTVFSLHFDEVVDLVARWWGEQKFMDSPCDGIYVRMDFNRESSNHAESIKKELKTIMNTLGYEIDSLYSDDLHFLNDKVYVYVVVDNSGIQCVANPKSTINNAQKSYSYHNLVGNIAGSDVHMSMIVEGGTMWGRYYYDSQRKNGSTAYMSFFGEYYETGWDLTEYYSDINKPTGTYNGEWEGDLFSGTFTRAKDGKAFAFSLTIVQGGSDDFFKEEDLIKEKPSFE